MKKLFLFLFPILVISCKDNEGVKYEAASVDAIKLSAPSKSYDRKAESYDMEVVDSAAAPVGAPTMINASKIIKSANLKFASTDVNKTFDDIQKLTNQYQAVIQNDNSGKNDYSVFRNLTIRVPNQHFDAFIANLSKGVNHFDQKEISQQDVTEEYVDVESRMKSKKKLEERYLQLLAKANKVSEMLEIEQQLAEIREEIEAKEGRLKYIQNRVAMSTIDIEMYTENPSESGATHSFGSKIWNSIKEGFNQLSNFVLSIISIWPFILIFVGMIFLIRRRFFKKKV